jgi:hypothetical protein
MRLCLMVIAPTSGTIKVYHGGCLLVLPCGRREAKDRVAVIVAVAVTSGPKQS